MRNILSIIIPHYNSPDTLKILMDSIPDKEEIQIIVVDDKSSREWEEILSATEGKQEAEVFVLKNETSKKGAGVCRNIALDFVKGEWLLFADADDYFTTDMWRIVNGYFSGACDIVYFRPVSYILGTNERSDKRGRFYEEIIDRYLEDCESEYNCMRLRYSWYVPWSKLIRSRLVFENAIRFDETIVANDVMFSAKCGHFAGQIDACNEIIYCVTEQAGTLTQTVREEWFDIRVETYLRRDRFMKSVLSEDEMKIFKFSGTFLVLKAMKDGFGAEKARQLMRLFDENGIRYSKKLIREQFPEV